MNKATEEMFNDLLSTAKILVEAPNNVNWDLAHYIADNIIGKINMLKLNEDKGYSESQAENFPFPKLIEVFEREFPSIDLDYEEIKAQHSKGRNTFQHKLITNYLGIRQTQARLYVQILHQLMDKIGILNPKPNYSIIPKSDIPKYPLDTKSEIEFFIDRISQKDYEALLNRFYDGDFKEIFDKLFTKITMGTGHLELMSNSFAFVLGVDKVFNITPLFKQKEKYRVGWDNMVTAERVQVFLRDFRERVKLIHGFDL